MWTLLATFFQDFYHLQHLPLFFLFPFCDAVGCCGFQGFSFSPQRPPFVEALKEALTEHPRRQARHEEEWREAVERIHERLLQESGRRFFGNELL